MNFRDDEIIFLLGAGASADADIPVSGEMTKEIEEFFNKEKKEWEEYRELYYLVKSGVNFSYGIRGKNSKFNVEILLNELNEIEKKEMHPLYPFIGSWSVRFNEVMRDNFSIIGKLKKKILNELKNWVNPRNFKKSSYYKKLSDLKGEMGFPLRIFTLNYDLLVEKNLNSNITIQRGFNDSREWDYKLFLTDKKPDIYLYKLHGSIDWERDKDTNIVKYVDNIPEKPDLIFGVRYKLEYSDPYLFLISEFRYYSLKAKLIVCIGYSFSDEHINSIISQSLKRNKKAKVLVLIYVKEDDEKEIKKKIASTLHCDKKQLVLKNMRAQDFFEKELKLSTFEALFPVDESDNILK